MKLGLFATFATGAGLAASTVYGALNGLAPVNPLVLMHRAAYAVLGSLGLM